MALVGHISGSQQSNSLIGVSGTVIVANRPEALFPSSLPGADVSFFVSGSRGGKGSEAERTVSVFGGDAVVSGSLTIGTGSVTITSNDVQFGSFANRIELVGNDIKFFDGNNATGKTLAQLAHAAAGGNNTEVQYNNSGSLAGASTFTFNSSENRLTVGQAAIPTALTASTLKAGGSTVNLFDDTATTINFGAGASSAFNIGPSAGVTTISGDLKVGGNDIIASDNQTNITMTSNTLTTFAGDIKVGGNDIQASDGTTALTLAASTGNVTVAGDLQVSGNDIKSSGGNTAITLTAAGNVVIPGDLTVNGTTTTVDATNVTIKDSVIGLGFESGSTSVASGDRGWVGGLTGGNNVAMIWKNSATEFEAIFTADSAASSSISSAGWANFAAGVVKANSGLSGSHTKLTDGTSAFIAGTGITITSASNGAVTITSTASTSPGSPTNSVQFNDGGSFGGSSTFTFDKTGGASNLGKLSVNETLSTTVTSSTLVAGASTVNVFNATATTLNVGGAATSILIGASNVTMGVGGATPGSSTITASTGSFGRVIATGAGTSTFAGTISANNGIASNGNASFTGGSVTFTASSNIVGAGTNNRLENLSVTGSSGFFVTSGPTGISGSITLGDLAQSPSDTVTFNATVNSNILPTTDRLYNLGSPTARWNNVYTGDLHLRNERGNWTVIEEESYLSIRNNLTGKMYKFVLEEIADPDPAE